VDGLRARWNILDISRVDGKVFPLDPLLFSSCMLWLLISLELHSHRVVKHELVNTRLVLRKTSSIILGELFLGINAKNKEYRRSALCWFFILDERIFAHQKKSTRWCSFQGLRAYLYDSFVKRLIQRTSTPPLKPSNFLRTTDCVSYLFALSCQHLPRG